MDSEPLLNATPNGVYLGAYKSEVMVYSTSFPLNACAPAETTVGTMIGKVIMKKVLIGPEPKDAADSSSEQLTLNSDARVSLTTVGIDMIA